MFVLNKKYLFLALLLFLAEVFIALFIQDAIIRPYGGDFLVVMLLYCVIKGVVNWSALTAAAAVLTFSYLLETLQYFKLVELLGLERYPLANVIIGTSFAWWDIAAYTSGIVTVLTVETKAR